MLNFQQQQEKDLDDVFFNILAFEFVTTHSIAGIKGKQASPPKECNVIVDHELYVERRISSKAENVSLNGLLFFIKKSEWLEKFNNVPSIGAALQFDGKRYQVDAVRDNMGVLEITLEAYRG